ncbi:hypothetical protein Cph01nite_36920 [Cellulomonas phragmiteti]|uniref:Integrase catalytic domain-containing protein n=1 Tax=Cellulomonas phragmiteti TaxID=478780 RepID=A0ABQ4DRF3_9CELL|nr:hypothetical protein Cph01nite_36920 [Cellulomonas phragmiteti]
MLQRPVEPSQYVAVRYTQRLAEAGAVASIGSTGDSYDNALAEAFDSLSKAELVRNRGPWKSIDDLEIAVAEYIDWFNHRRLHGEIGLVPPAEHEANHYRHNTARLPSKRQFRASTEPITRHPAPGRRSELIRLGDRPRRSSRGERTCGTVREEFKRQAAIAAVGGSAGGRNKLPVRVPGLHAGDRAR